MAKNSSYDSVKQGMPNTTMKGGKGANTGQNKKPAGWVETSTTADKPIFFTGKK